MEISLWGMTAVAFILRWLHFFFGVMWIGYLYYFNFTHGAFMAEAEAVTKPGVLTKLLPRAMWWFRWGAMGTLITGLLYMGILAHMGNSFSSSWGLAISIGALFGIVMWANVWFVIWPAQQVVIANAEAVAKGGAANTAAAANGAKALLASRTNTLFSIPMLFFMGAASHLPLAVTPETKIGAVMGLVTLVVAALELNALKGKLGPLTTIKGVIHMGFVLTLVVYALVEIGLRM